MSARPGPEPLEPRELGLGRIDQWDARLGWGRLCGASASRHGYYPFDRAAWTGEGEPVVGAAVTFAVSPAGRVLEVAP